MKALLITGKNQYNVVSFFLEGMIEDLERLGIQSALIDACSDQAIQDSIAAIPFDGEPDFIISYNGLGLDFVADGKPLFDGNSCPIYVFLVDHPVHLMQRFMGVKCTVLCVDKTHVSFCQLCGIKAEFFPHALAESQYRQDAFISYEDKQDIVAPVSYFDVEHWKNELKPVWQQLAPLIEKANNIWEFMCYLGVIPMNNQPPRLGLDQQVLTILRCVDYYYRGKDRISGLQQLTRLDLPVKLFGNNTNAFMQYVDNLTVREALNVAQLTPEIAKAKYVFHAVPGFSAALHDRLLLAIANGTIAITDNAKSVAQVEPDFRLVALNAAHLPSMSDYESMRLTNLQIARERHSWHHRFKVLLETILP